MFTHAYLCLPRTVLTIRHLRPFELLAKPPAADALQIGWSPQDSVGSVGSVGSFGTAEFSESNHGKIVPYILSHKYCAIQNAMSSSQETKYIQYIRVPNDSIHVRKHSVHSI